MHIRRWLGELKRSMERTRDKWPQEKRVRAAMKQYEAVHGYTFDLNKPTLFTEKVVWYKLFYESADLVRIVDKFLFKQYIEEKLGAGYTIPLYGAWETVDALRRDWASLPEEFCLKSTLMSDGRGIMMVHNKSSMDLDKLCKEVSHWLKPYNTLINSYCRAYYAATPRIIAEAFLTGLNGAYDYKFFCFSGTPKYVYGYQNRLTEGNKPSDVQELTFYDMDWNKQDVVYHGFKNGVTPKPKHYTQMIEIAKTLSKDFPFVRVDFYELDDRIYVGELTLYPNGGLKKYEPREFNLKLGDEFVLPVSEQ